MQLQIFFDLEYRLSSPPKRFLPPFGLGTPEAESLEQDVRKHVVQVRKTSINELRNALKLSLIHI